MNKLRYCDVQASTLRLRMQATRCSPACSCSASRRANSPSRSLWWTRSCSVSSRRAALLSFFQILSSNRVERRTALVCAGEGADRQVARRRDAQRGLAARPLLRVLQQSRLLGEYAGAAARPRHGAAREATPQVLQSDSRAFRLFLEFCYLLLLTSLLYTSVAVRSLMKLQYSKFIVNTAHFVASRVPTLYLKVETNSISSSFA